MKWHHCLSVLWCPCRNHKPTTGNLHGKFLLSITKGRDLGQLLSKQPWSAPQLRGWAGPAPQPLTASGCCRSRGQRGLVVARPGPRALWPLSPPFLAPVTFKSAQLYSQIQTSSLGLHLWNKPHHRCSFECACRRGSTALTERRFVDYFPK